MDVKKDVVNKILHVNDLKKSLQNFGFIDYSVFGVMLVVSALIGYYFGFIRKTKQIDNENDAENVEALNYLVGGRKMKVIPVGLSLVASFLSGISLLGNSTEIYVYGTQYAFALLTILSSAILAWYIFLPVFCDLQLTSLYQYLEMRYDRKIHLLATFINIIGIVLWLSIVIYIPGLVFNQITGIHIHLITPIVCVVCIFYTCVGGIKAVIWTDVFQSFLMLSSVGLVAIKGTFDIGGLREVFIRSLQGDRLEFPEVTIDPTVRLSIISVVIGGTMTWTQNTCGSQVMMQRFLSVPSINEARKVLIVFVIGTIILISICIYNGLLIFATYHQCDPLSTSLVTIKDQLLPLLVIDVLGKYPGLIGIFVAGVMSAALSTLSTGLNSLSAIFLEDLFKKYRKSSLTIKQTILITRLTVVIFGIICYSFVSVIEKLGMILELSATLGSITNGSIFGLFLMGILMPWINAKCALSGGIFSFIIMSWICIRAQMSLAIGYMVHREKPVTTNGCEYTFDSMSNMNGTNLSETDETDFNHMSFMLYSTAGALLTIIGSNFAMLIFGKIAIKDWNRKLIAPFLQKMYPLSVLSVQNEINEMKTFIKK